MSLFDAEERETMNRAKPLAARMRPRTLDEFVGVFAMRHLQRIFGSSRRLAGLVLLITICLAGQQTFAGESAAVAYAFAAPPLEIYDRLPELKLGEVPAMSCIAPTNADTSPAGTSHPVFPGRTNSGMPAI